MILIKQSLAASLSAAFLLCSTSFADSPSPTTEELQSAIEADFDDAGRLSENEIDVVVESNIVTLAGTVLSLQDRQIAESIAKRTRGVVAVQNRILVKRSSRSDSEIQSDVRKVLRFNDGVEKPPIKTEVSGGTVALLGEVDSLAQKRIAEFAAAGVRGVSEVDNQITVRMSSDRSDEELRAEISALIVQSVYFDNANIDVQVNEHVAKLSGAVGSVAAKDRLGQIAEIWGIAAVDVTDVEVNPDKLDDSLREQRYADMDDQSITAAVRRSFEADPYLFSRVEEIDVSTKQAKVQLTGTVDRGFVQTRAAELVRNVVGVRRINNDLEVEYPNEQPSDATIIKETQQALARSGHLDRREIRVHCDRAHVSLYGLVDSQLEKRVAHAIADGVAGVVHVNNSLAVEAEPSGKSDERITKDLNRKLKYTLLDRSDQIDVTVEDGVAILRGHVDTWLQWQTAMDLAVEAGAHHPHNMIKVRYHPPHSGEQYFIPQ
ncbi:BON domain-containing protein [Rhodopirellula bahusiensis]|uniref:Ornithine aminotransferase n=1 Tax=Rhodopirellula bahusiensis TaxID=2014065 RepID=A0A2G1VXQ7_9BACT|nr:BON domain-containing protein [Rhodopirellula bahusiensis]PHQ31574.1 ornithine aminotransferase [Rhodopirellula bahusiensis]